MTTARNGRREFARATGGHGIEPVARVRATSPTLADGITEFAFGQIFARSGLGAREREMITVAVLAAIGGADNQLAIHAPAAIECGVDPDELVVICEQVAPYAGFPRALNALRAVRTVIEQAGLPLPLPYDRVELGDHATHVTDVGSGRPILLVHPIGLDRLVWRDVIREVADERRVIAADLRGHGGAAGAPPAASGAQLIRDLHELLEACEVSEVDVAGLGSGAVIAAELACREPGRVGRLCLVAPPTALDGDLCRDRGARPAPWCPDALVGELLPRWFSPASLARNDWGVRHARDRLHRMHQEDWIAAWDALADIAEAPRRLGVFPGELRLVDGDHDRITGPDQVGGLAAQIADAEVTAIPRAPHLMSAEGARPIARALTA